MPSGKAKGNNFEREICRTLSLWWSKGESDSIFWRSASSGGMATQRAKKGLESNQQGDISSISREGYDLTDRCVVEIKRGYKKWSILDMIDKKSTAAQQPIETFLIQLEREMEESDRKYGVLVCRRDRRDSIVIVNEEFPTGGISASMNFSYNHTNWKLFRLDAFTEMNPEFMRVRLGVCD